MTIQDLKKMKKEILTPCDVASVLGCDPGVIRLQAGQNIKQLGFPASKIGTRIKIPRRAFIDWFEGRLVANVAGSFEGTEDEQEKAQRQWPGNGYPTG